MANVIETFKNYVPMLDEVYKAASLTGYLDGAAELAREGANANELIIPMMELDGLADYDRNGGYTAGSVNLTNQTVACNFDRGRKFNVDNLDNAETAGIAFGRLAAEFIRTKVVPEIDAFRIAKYASKENVETVAADLTTGANVVAAVRAGTNKMDEEEVPVEGRVLLITPTLKGLIDDLDTTKSKAILGRFEKVIEVPQSRMYTAIQQKSGKDGEVVGGYAKASGAKNINFMILHKDALIQYQKHVAPRVFDPAVNQEADAWQFTYRNVGIAEVYKNKVAGVYVHTATA